MAREFNAYLTALGDKVPFALEAARIRRDGFGINPAFGGLIAERDRVPLCYLLHHQGYDADRAERILVVCNLFVREEGRRQGIGRALMAAAMEHCRRIGGCGLTWSVYRPNRLAFDFYRSLGAQPIEDLDFMWLPV